jgi:hypothetical protein
MCMWKHGNVHMKTCECALESLPMYMWQCAHENMWMCTWKFCQCACGNAQCSIENMAMCIWKLANVHMKTWECEFGNMHYHNPSFRLATKAKGLQGCKLTRNLGVKARGSSRIKARRSPGITSHTPGNVKKCEGVWGSEPSHSQDNSHFGRSSPGGLLKFQRVIARVKTQWLVVFFISLESS